MRKPHYPPLSLDRLQQAILNWQGSNPSGSLDTIEIHVLYGGSGHSDKGTTAQRSRLAAFGRFISLRAPRFGISKHQKRRARRDSCGRKTTCAVWELQPPHCCLRNLE